MSNFHWLKTGISIDKYPVVGNGVLNYYLLKRTVQSLGGFECVNGSNLWPVVCAELRLATKADTTASTSIQMLYQQFVLPYESYVDFCKKSFLFSDSAGSEVIKPEPVTPVNLSPTVTSGPTFSAGAIITPRQGKENDHSSQILLPRPNKRPNESLPSPPPDRVLRPRREDVLPYLLSNNQNEEFKQNECRQDYSPETESESKSEEFSPCQICEENAPNNLFCKRCEQSYHYTCLGPKLSLVSSSHHEKWYCPKCLVGDGMFLFDEGEEYDLADFQEMADKFREDYLDTEFPIVNINEREVVECLVEQRFWNHVNDINCKLAVEYGADIRCDIKGSGFPTRSRDPYNRYSKHPWNLNNFPLNKMSLFHNMRVTISGVTVPWAYVGMMFSAFCWHSEDHDTYSLNYEHFGDTKTWYGIPQYAAARFETFSRNYVPELFEKQPDILFQRATMIPPETLIEHGIPCYAIDQRAGQFVITFPHAYHAGFNHGFNFNEAVNYAPPDWVSIGKAAVMSYKQEKRSPIFSHDYLLVQTALNDRRKETAEWLYDEFKQMVHDERIGRQRTLQTAPGIPEILVKSDSLDEDNYQCADCNCLSYLSRIKVIQTKGSKKVEGIYCHDHVPKTVERDQRLVMECRFTLEELDDLCGDLRSLLEPPNQLVHGMVQAIEV